MSSLFFSEITCPPVQHSAHSIANTSVATFDTVVLYTCLPGFWFADSESETSTAVCLPDKTWSTSIQDCSGSEGCCPSIQQEYFIFHC